MYNLSPEVLVAASSLTKHSLASPITTHPCVWLSQRCDWKSKQLEGTTNTERKYKANWVIASKRILHFASKHCGFKLQQLVTKVLHRETIYSDVKVIYFEPQILNRVEAEAGSSDSSHNSHKHTFFAWVVLQRVCVDPVQTRQKSVAVKHLNLVPALTHDLLWCHAAG